MKEDERRKREIHDRFNALTIRAARQRELKTLSRTSMADDEPAAEGRGGSGSGEVAQDGPAAPAILGQARASVGASSLQNKRRRDVHRAHRRTAAAL